MMGLIHMNGKKWKKSRIALGMMQMRIATLDMEMIIMQISCKVPPKKRRQNMKSYRERRKLRVNP